MTFSVAYDIILTMKKALLFASILVIIGMVMMQPAAACCNIPIMQNPGMNAMVIQSNWDGFRRDNLNDSYQTVDKKDELLELMDGSKSFKPIILSFQPDDQIRKATLSASLDELGKNDPEYAAQLRKLDIFKILQGELQKHGINTNDLSDGMGMLMMELWEISNKQPYDPNDVEVDAEDLEKHKALKNYAALLLSFTDPDLGTNKTKLQQVSDRVWFLALVLSATRIGAHSSGGDAVNTLALQTRKLGEAILGVDLRDVDLTEKGFVPRNPKAFATKYGQ